MTTGENDDGRLRLLPVRPRPKTGESTDSYVRRLARANHLKPSYLRGYLVGPPDYGRGKRPRADRLAAVAGRRQDTLERALSDLVRQKRTEPDRPKRRFTKSGHPLTQQADTAAVTTLHRLLGEFFDAREQSDGLARIFRGYQSWLTTQAWYQFETAEPDQIG